MELKECVTTRRSIRKYLPTPISHDVLEELINDALTAPSGTNLQPWYFVVLETPEAVAAYKKLMKESSGSFRQYLEKRFPTHPEVVEETLDYMATMGGAPVIVLAFLYKSAYNDGGSASPFLQSVAAAIENLLLVAWNRGIGSCWMTAPLAMGVVPELEKTYAPDHGTFVAAVSLGYPAEEPKMPRRRDGRIAFL